MKIWFQNHRYKNKKISQLKESDDDDDAMNEIFPLLRRNSAPTDFNISSSYEFQRIPNTNNYPTHSSIYKQRYFNSYKNHGVSSFNALRSNETMYEQQIPGHYYSKDFHYFSLDSSSGYLWPNTYDEETLGQNTKNRNDFLRGSYKSYSMDTTSHTLPPWTQTKYAGT